MRADVSLVPVERLKRMLTEAGFSFGHPDPILAWEVFKAFVREPLAVNDNNVTFHAGRRGLGPRYKFGLDYVLAFWAETEGERALERLVLGFACEMPRRFTLKKYPTCLRVSDFASLDQFFEAVELSDDFRLATTLSPWTCETYSDSERW
jgi:hypothetical protein